MTHAQLPSQSDRRNKLFLPPILPAGAGGTSVRGGVSGHRGPREERGSGEGTINIDGICEDYKMSGINMTLKLTDVLGNRSVFVQGK